jgi:deoxyribodipyrimidine photo-lyase
VQAEKFDAEAKYIQRWVPELRGLKAKDTFEPIKRLGAAKVRSLGYYAPIVQHAAARDRAVAAYGMKEEGNKGGNRRR